MKSLSKFLSFKLIAGSLVLLMMVSCQPEDSSDVNQDRIYTHYELFYNSNDDKTHAVARFRFGNPTGTLLELTDPAAVTFNGDDMPYSIAYNGHHKEYAGLVNAGTFEYTNVDGDVFVNSVDTFNTIAFPASLDTISKSSAFTLTWDGEPLGPDEEVGIFIGSWTWGDDALFFTNDNGATNIVMGTNQLSNVSTGPSIVYMDRTNRVDAAQAPDAGGVVLGKFRAENAQVEIVD